MARSACATPKLRSAAGICAFLLVAIWLASSAILAQERQPLWPDKPPIGDGPVVDGPAFVTVYRPQNPNGTLVVICPGGGYGGLALEPEGHGIARWLNRHSIIGVVLEYRMPRGNRFVPLYDAQRALRWTRANAASWNADPTRVGVMGFSAGGHLASTAATHFDLGQADSADPIQRVSCRPDFSILIYPVITMGSQTHGGSRSNLLGPEPDTDTIALYSNELQVTENTPPAFLAHARDDRVVVPENSRLFHRALRQHGVESRYLELPWGDHGLRGYRGATWNAWQRGAIQWMIDQKWVPESEAEPIEPASSMTRWPRWDELNQGPHQVRLLPGTSQFIFSLYGVPGDAQQVRELVDLLRDRNLANGFDPGPGASASQTAVLDYLAANGWPLVLYSGGEMQIQGGRGQFGKEHYDALASFDRLGVFSAYQLGEWGYYLHNLSPRESWWKDVYGPDFEKYRHLMKPAGLAGYDKMPTSKRECYDFVKNYFQSRQRDLLGRVISVTGHSHYEAYAGEWGARCIGLELGENIAFTQSKLAFARGASRQWNRPWSVQVSPWFGPAVTTNGPLRVEGGIARGLDAGHSLSFYRRLWLHSWFAGASMVTPENSISAFFEQPQAPWNLTSHGHEAAQVFQFTQSHDRGIPYTPIAVVLDHLAGYNGYMDRPWGILEPTAGDREARDLFDHQLFPGADHIHQAPDADNPESSYLRPTPYGEIFDVLLSNVSENRLSHYPVILLVGDIDFTPHFLDQLQQALRTGSRVLISTRHREQLGVEFERLATHGSLEVLAPWVNPQTGRHTAISNDRLATLSQDWLPVEASGDEVQYACNRTSRGWVVELINSRGVAKKGNEPARVDASAIAHLTLRAKFPTQEIRCWRTTAQTTQDSIRLEIGPGEVEYVEFVEGPAPK